MTWYKEWFGEEYLDLYAHRDAREAARQIDFVLRLFGDSPPGAVLDLACGAGRHSRDLCRRGVATVGVDLSMTLLVHSRGVPKVAGDMRCLPFSDRSFDWVLNFFTSFGYFENERENFRVLEEIVRVLEPGGGFLIDLLNVGHALRHLREKEVQEFPGRRAEIRRWYDPHTRRINKRICLQAPGRSPQTFLESVRAYQPDEVVIGLRWAGLEVGELYGSFEGDGFCDESERLILVGHKSA